MKIPFFKFPRILVGLTKQQKVTCNRAVKAVKQKREFTVRKEEKDVIIAKYVAKGWVYKPGKQNHGLYNLKFEK